MKLNLFGDICLHDIDWAQFQFDENLIDLMRDAINVANLENPVTDYGVCNPLQVANLSSSKDSLALIKSFQAVSLANNHIQDFGDVGCMDTLTALEDRGIAHFGLGRSHEEALRPLIIARGEIRVAFLGATRFANARSNLGTAPEKIRLLQNAIRALKDQGCFVVPFFHWGYEYVRIPSPRERRIAHACIRAGADLIVGAHPHIYQAVEEYSGRKIFYSLGNFIFHSGLFDKLAPIPGDERLCESFFVQIDIHSNHAYTINMHGYKTGNQGVHLMDHIDNHRLVTEVHRISEAFNHGRIAYWNAYYGQAREISKQSIKLRNQFQRPTARGLSDLWRMYTSFNAQDLKNRVACHIPWFFR